MLGLGVSHVPLVQDARGHEYHRPVATMRKYLDALDRVQLQPALEHDAAVVLAALGPKMLELAGSRTQGAFPYNTTPAHTAQAREIIGPDKCLVVDQKVLLTEDAPSLGK